MPVDAGSSASGCSSVVPTGTAESGSSSSLPNRSSVYQSDINRRSRRSKFPTSFLFFVTGTPEILYRRITSSASAIVCSGVIVTGSSRSSRSPDRFTLSISPACRGQSLQIAVHDTQPTPSCAIAIASRASVTASIAADISGVLSCVIFRGQLRLCAYLGRDDLIFVSGNVEERHQK